MATCVRTCVANIGIEATSSALALLRHNTCNELRKLGTGLMPKISLVHILIGKMSRSKLGAVCGDVERSGRIAGVDQARSSDKVIEQVVVTDINHLSKEIGVQHICLLKADTEAAEQAELLHCNKFPPALSFEYHLTRGLGEDKWNKVERRLTQLGYRLFVRRQNVHIAAACEGGTIFSKLATDSLVCNSIRQAPVLGMLCCVSPASGRWTSPFTPETSVSGFIL